MPIRGRSLLLGLAAVLCLGGGPAALAATAVASPGASDQRTEPSSPTTSPTLPPGTKRDSCEFAQLLVQAEQYEEAVDAYIAVQEENPDEACVEEGMLALIDAMERADAPEVVDTCEVVDIFRDEEAFEKARTVYEAYIEKTAERCPGITLGDLKEPEDESFADTATDFVKEWWLVAVYVLVAGVLVWALGTWLLRRHSAGYRARARTKRPPEVLVTELKHPDGQTSISREQLEATLRRPMDGAPAQEAFHIVDAYQDLVTDLGDIAKLHTTLEPVTAALSMLQRARGREQWTIGGSLRTSKEASGQRLHCDATFKSRGRTIQNAQFVVPVAGDAPSEGEKAALVACVAGWVEKIAAKLNEEPLPERPSPHAYGWLRGGAEAQERGLPVCAEFCYQEAASEEEYPRARIARALVLAELTSSDRQGAEQAVRILNGEAGRFLPAPGEEFVQDDLMVDVLRLGYGLAAAYAHLGLELAGDGGTFAVEDPEPHLRSAKELAARIAAAGAAVNDHHAGQRSRTSDGAPSTPVSPAAARFVTDSLIPGCEVLAAGVQMSLYDKDAADAARAIRDDMLRLASNGVPHRVSYNLACYWSTWLAPKWRNEFGTVPGEQTPEKLALGALDRALRDAPQRLSDSIAKWAKEDPSLKPLRERDPAAFASIVTAPR